MGYTVKAGYTSGTMSVVYVMVQIGHCYFLRLNLSTASRGMVLPILRITALTFLNLKKKKNFLFILGNNISKEFCKMCFKIISRVKHGCLFLFIYFF